MFKTKFSILYGSKVEKLFKIVKKFGTKNVILKPICMQKLNKKPFQKINFITFQMMHCY